MTFGGFVVSGALVIAIIVLFVLFIMSFGVFFISFVSAICNRKEKGSGTVSALFAILSAVFLIPLIFAVLYLYNNADEIIKFGEDKSRINESTISEFFAAIDEENSDELDRYLEENSNLLYSKDEEGLLPLGRAIKQKNLESVKYFMRKEVDINKVTDNEKTGTIEFMLNNNCYDENVLEYLLTQADLDVNKKASVTPVAQLYVKTICQDNIVSEKEVELLESMISIGLNLKQTNGANTDTYELVKNNTLNSVQNIDELRDVIESSKE